MNGTYTGLYIKIGIDSSTSTKVDLVSWNERSWLFALDIYSSRVTWYDLVVSDRDFVLRFGLKHDTPWFEMLEIAVINVHVSIDGNQTCCAGIICSITFELAIDHLNWGAIKNCDARDFTISLPEDSTGEKNRNEMSTSDKPKKRTEKSEKIRWRLDDRTYSSDRIQLCSLSVPLLSKMMQYCFFLGSMGGALAPSAPVTNYCLKIWVKNSLIHFSFPLFSKFIGAIKL